MRAVSPTDDEGMPVSLLDGYATTPARQGLYDPQFERDACGVALVATLSGVPSNDVVKQALTSPALTPRVSDSFPRMVLRAPC